jgi:uncharacterized protein YqgV (UPF0045/DUF77 family)
MMPETYIEKKADGYWTWFEGELMDIFTTAQKAFDYCAAEGRHSIEVYIK